MDNNLNICSICHFPVSETYYFCPNCGNNLREKPEELSLFKKLSFYALAIFLPPLGLWPGIKYLEKKDPKARELGVITILLTLVSSFLVTWLIFKMFNNYISQINEALIF